MNFLETGTYLFSLVCVLLLFYETDEEAIHIWSYGKSVAVGFLLGWMFWVRIDSVFIILAVCLSYLFRGIPYGSDHIKRRFMSVLVFGSVSVIVASPWLVSNYLRFGSIVPVSGQSQGMANFAHNISAVPTALIEYLAIAVPIPLALEKMPIVPLLCALLLPVAIFIAVLMWRRVNHAHRSLMLTATIVVVCYCGYYGLFFGAKHFVSRYLIVLAPFFSLFTAAIVISLINNQEWPFASFAKALAVALALIVVGLNIRIFLNGAPHQHFQVVEWVEKNVPENTWIGAVQTGTLGYFHDRTINLDGKVNPDALLARQGKAFCPELESKPADCLMYYLVGRELWYLVDWIGIESWMKKPPMKDYFVVEVLDPEINLAVLKRNGAPEK